MLITLKRAEQMVSHFYHVYVHGTDPVCVCHHIENHLFPPVQFRRQYCSFFWHSRNIFQNEHVSGRVAPEDRQRAEKRHCTSMWVMCPVSAIDHSPRNTQISNTYSYPLTAPENKGKIATKSLVKLNENLNWIDLCAFQCVTGGLCGEGVVPVVKCWWICLQTGCKPEEWISLPTGTTSPSPKTSRLCPTFSRAPSLHLSAIFIFSLKHLIWTKCKKH